MSVSPGRVGTWLHRTMYGETVSAYLPGRMPPEPPVDVTEIIDLLDVANQAVGRLDGMSNQIPDKYLFLYCSVRKEALVSSQIEGTQSSLVDLLLMETEEQTVDAPTAQAEEVSHYIRAIHHGLTRMNTDLPLSLRLIREMHSILLSSGRGSQLHPGEFRTSQNWIGGDRPGNAIYVPPPPEHLMECLDAFEKFLHLERRDLPVLAQAAMLHAQFESIHPFLDGNGRIGRLLVTLFLCMRGVLKDPLLYPSLYLKQNRTRYYELLQKVRHEGAWEEWVRFFLTGVIQAAGHATYGIHRLLEIRQRDRAKVEKLGRAAPNALKLYEMACRNPVLSITYAARKLELSHQTTSKLFLHLAAAGILQSNERQRGKVYRYNEFLAVLAEGTEPLKAVL